MLTRRNLLQAAACAPLLAATPLASAFAEAIQWRVIHGLRPHRVAANRGEAIGKYLWLIDHMQFSKEALAYFHRVIPTERGERVVITNQDYLWMAFYENGMRGVEQNLRLRATTPQYAERWIFPGNPQEAVDLPETCENFARPVLLAPPRHCFDFRLGFEGMPLIGYLWFDDLYGKSPEEIDVFWRALLASDCFKVRSAGGASIKPALGCDICRPGSDFRGWPGSMPPQDRRRAEIIVQIPAGQSRVISFSKETAVHYATYCPEDLRTPFGSVDPAVTSEQLSLGIWDYGSVIEPYSGQ